MIGASNDANRLFLQSRPVRVRMAGFESNTTTLQSHGWQMSVETFRLFERDAEEMRVAFKHDGIKQVALGRMIFSSRELVYNLHNPHAMSEMWQKVGIDISCIAPMIRCHIMPMVGVPTFSAIDARPSFIDTKEIDLMDLAVFKPIKGENFEIYINQKDEQELLDILLKKQNIKQKEIRQNQKRREYEAGNEGYFMPDDGFMKDRMNQDVKHQIVICGAA